MSRKERSLWAALRKRIKTATSVYGQRAALARRVGVTPQAVAEWLSGSSAPTAETTLQLLEWVTAEEAQQNKNRSSASTPLRRKTRLRKPSQNENLKSSPPKI